MKGLEMSIQMMYNNLGLSFRWIGTVGTPFKLGIFSQKQMFARQYHYHITVVFV